MHSASAAASCYAIHLSKWTGWCEGWISLAEHRSRSPQAPGTPLPLDPHRVWARPIGGSFLEVGMVAKPHCSLPKAGLLLTVVSLQVTVYTPLNVFIGAGVPDLLGCSVPWCQATCSNSDQAPCRGIGPSTLRDGADRQSPQLGAVGCRCLPLRRLSLSHLSGCSQATQMFGCYVPLQSIGLPTCSHSSSVLLAQCGPLGEGPAGSLIGPGEPASHSGGLWPRAFKRGVPIGPMCSRRLRQKGSLGPVWVFRLWGVSGQSP